MVVFPVSINVGPVKEILKVAMSDLYLMKKVVILKKIQMTMKVFAPPFFNCSSLSLNRKKRVTESHKTETKHIYASAADLLHNTISQLVQMQTLL